MEVQQTFESGTATVEAKHIVKDLLDTYRESTYRANSIRLGKEDSLREFIAGETLDQMRQQARLKDAQGVRAYFARYPDTYEDLELAGRQTLAFTVEYLKYSPKRFIIPDDIDAFGPTCKMNRNKMDALLTTYRQVSHKINSDRMRKEDSSSVFFSLEIMDQICEQIASMDTAGVYAYFGRYPNHYFDAERAGRQTIVLTISNLKPLKDGYVIPEDLFAFFDMPFCPPVCNCGGPGLPAC